MKRKHYLFLIAIGMSAGAAQAEMYKWTGPDGKTIYSDQPPPASVNAEKKTIAASGGSIDLPYELAQATGNHPVVLYTTSKCAPCDAGRKLLSDRGVPYREKTITSAEDAERLRAVAGAEGQLPTLTVGRATQVGFESGAWSKILTAAGYPQTSRLPRGYSNPPTEPAAPPAKVVAAAKEAEINDASLPAPARPTAGPANSTGTAPRGFQF
jgi:glutaredoxin